MYFLDLVVSHCIFCLCQIRLVESLTDRGENAVVTPKQKIVSLDNGATRVTATSALASKIVEEPLKRPETLTPKLSPNGTSAVVSPEPLSSVLFGFTQGASSKRLGTFDAAQTANTNTALPSVDLASVLQDLASIESLQIRPSQSVASSSSTSDLHEAPANTQIPFTETPILLRQDAGLTMPTSAGSSTNLEVKTDKAEAPPKKPGLGKNIQVMVH